MPVSRMLQLIQSLCALAVDNGGLCPTQESKLAVLWTIGIFALNFGPVFVGPVLDWVGPKITTVLGSSSLMSALHCPPRSSVDCAQGLLD